MTYPNIPIARFVQNDENGRPLPAILAPWPAAWGDPSPETLDAQMERHEADIGEFFLSHQPTKPIIALQRAPSNPE